MTPLSSDLPQDLGRCHALIAQLRIRLDVASQRIAELESIGQADAVSRIAQLEALVAEQEKTMADFEQTIRKLSADNALLKRSLFGVRRERFTEDSQQGLLFDAQTLAAAYPPSSENDEQEPPAETPKKKRTSSGRQPRVFPDFLPREEERFVLNDEDIPEEMRDNPHTRRFFKKVGEQLELVPMQLKVIERYQEVIAWDRPDETTQFVAAPRPASLISSFAGPSVWAYVTTCRFADSRARRHDVPLRHRGARQRARTGARGGARKGRPDRRRRRDDPRRASGASGRRAAHRHRADPARAGRGALVRARPARPRLLRGGVSGHRRRDARGARTGMTEATHLNTLFQALADPTRRAVLARLSAGPESASTLAEPFDMALPSFMEHLKKLEACRLIETRKEGRTRICQLRVGALSPARDWIEEQRALWDARLDNLEELLDTMEDPER